jgi:signal transduction histidine kinase
MPDYYQVPALILTALLLPAFGYLYLRFRDTRTLLWFLGFLFSVVRMGLLYKLGSWDFQDSVHPWMSAAGQTSIQISSALFLGSLSPLSFRVGRINVLYVIPYTVPLVLYSILYHGVLRGATPTGLVYLVFPLLGILSLAVGFFWSVAKGAMPALVGAGFCGVCGAIALWLYAITGPSLPLTFVECCNHVLTALLLVYTFRRLSSGMILGVTGFLLWAAPVLLWFPPIAAIPGFDLGMTRAIILAKVIAAMGMILLALEDQLAINQTGQERERRARLELEAYTNLILSRRRVEDFDRQSEEICQTVATHSRFAQAALLLQYAGRYRLAGSAGLDSAIVSALEELAARIPVEGFLAPGSVPLAVEHSHTLMLDLDTWLRPGDDLKRLRFTTVLAVPMTGRSVTEGVLLLAGMRNAPQQPALGNLGNPRQAPLRADDLLPIEMLTERLQATRSQTMMLEKLIDSEKFAGLGQLAGNVTQQLNNPLTVILGYASLLDETSFLDPQERKGIEAILAEARRMRATLESLTRISRPQTGQFTAVSVAEMLTDMEHLHRSEFLRRSIEFRLSVAPGLPRVLCHAQQLRQAVLHCLQYAIEASESQSAVESDEGLKTVRLKPPRKAILYRSSSLIPAPASCIPTAPLTPLFPPRPRGKRPGWA